MTLDAPPPFTYHLVSVLEWEGCDDSEPYQHPSLATEGFIHCTDGALELAATANRYYQGEVREMLALEIDRERISAPMRYEDPRRIYPHIYGPLNRNAIVRVLAMKRGTDGQWLPPELA